ncbi:MAG: hypothetical protein VX127_02915, partial [Myxococcota bacterium]|nr:hypothetical protein [Myxococcota bacterium]
MRFNSIIPIAVLIAVVAMSPAVAAPPMELSPTLRGLNDRMHGVLREVVSVERQQLGPLIM